jgi:hypothetical protein
LTIPTARTYFAREAGTWLALEKHPSVVRCFHMEMVDNIPFLFLEWVAAEERYCTGQARLNGLYFDNNSNLSETSHGYPISPQVTVSRCTRNAA